MLSDYHVAFPAISFTSIEQLLLLFYIQLYYRPNYYRNGMLISQGDWSMFLRHCLLDPMVEFVTLKSLFGYTKI